MKIKLLIIIVFSLIVVGEAQSISEDRKQEILSKIGEVTDISTVYDVGDYKIYEAIPLLEKYFHQQKDIVKTSILEVLLELGSEKTLDYAQAYFDSISTLNYSNEVEEKAYFDYLVDVAYVLFTLGDFSRADYILNKDDKFKSFNSSYLLMLYSMARSNMYPEFYKEEAKKFFNSPYWIYKCEALYFYTTYFREEVLPYAKEIFLTDDNPDVRLYLSNNIFLAIRNNESINFLIERMMLDPDEVIRHDIAEELMIMIGTPAIYKKVQEYKANEIDSLYIDLTDFMLDNFEPPKPDSTLTASEMIDTLISYNNQCYNYSWITNKGIYNSLSQKLENAKKDLEKGKNKTAKNILEAFRNEVEAQKEKHITIDGYKFLYYYSGYILKRL